MPSQECPLCGKMAEFHNEPYGFDKKCFECDICLKFIIDSLAVKIISEAKSPKKVGEKLSEKSKKAGPTQVLEILGNKSGGTRTVSSQFVPEKEWSK